MEAFYIEGGHKLKGSIYPQGAKNEALEVICATLLTSDVVLWTRLLAALAVPPAKMAMTNETATYGYHKDPLPQTNPYHNRHFLAARLL